jgi:hypothetical protein
MIRIAITTAAYDAICATLPLGSVGYENQINERGERLIWLEGTTCPQSVHDDGGIACTAKIVTARSLMSQRMARKWKPT